VEEGPEVVFVGAKGVGGEGALDTEVGEEAPKRALRA
jgi:hypothetical protein